MSMHIICNFNSRTNSVTTLDKIQHSTSKKVLIKIEYFEVKNVKLDGHKVVQKPINL